MAGLSPDLTRHALEVPCPACEYPVWVIWAEIVAGSTVICPCCRVRVRLVDDTGSAQVAAAEIKAAVQAIRDVLRRKPL
jgi:hypothetical protein